MLTTTSNTITFIARLIIAPLLLITSSHLIASETSINTPSSCSFSGDFKQKKSLRGLDKAVESSGIFFFSCHHGVIWKTRLPVDETLVLNKNSQGSLLEANKVTPITSRQGRLLGKLINALMGADSEFINDNFDIQSTNQHHTLTPKKRRLKRAIKRIEFATSTVPVSHQETLNPQEVSNDNGSIERATISLLDRNDQWTHITSNKNVSYLPTDDGRGQCSTSKKFSELECQLLELTHTN